MRKFGKRTILAAVFAFVLALQALAASPDELIPVGKTIGIELKTQEVTVMGFSETVHAAETAGLKKGDILETIDGKPVTSASQVSQLLKAAPVRVTVLRGGKRQEFYIVPERVDGTCYLGILVKDTMAGIGTVTYYDPNTGEYGALGHGVSDKKTEQLVPMASGRVVQSSVVDVQKGREGKPGALRGVLESTELGTVERNTNVGIFGTMEPFATQSTALPVAESWEVEPGEAQILSNVTGTETSSYTVRIEQVDANDSRCRNLLLRVTDPALIDRTGGIVQGMSGSPIIQNGKLVGAVTHVLVNEPTMGYGILIENMLNAAS